MNIILLRIEDFIFKAAAWKLVTLILLVMLFKTGIWYIPNLDMSLTVALNPFTNPFQDPNAHYLLGNWLSPFLAWLSGIKAFWVFFAFHLGFSIAFTALFIKLAFSRLPERNARIALILFALLPVSATAYFWVGPDSLTLFLLLLALAFPSNTLMTLIIGMMLGMQHFVQAFFAVGGLLLAALLGRAYAIRPYEHHTPLFPWVLLAGIVIGKLALLGIFAHFDMQLNSGRLFWLKGHLNLLLGTFFFHAHQIIWSVLGLGWLVALKYADKGKQSLPFFITLAGLMLLLPISADQTRVLAIITFPLLAVYWLFSQDFLETFTNQQVAGLSLLGVLIPWGWVWGGGPHGSALQYDLVWLLHSVFGWFDVPEHPALWPFGGA